MTEKVVIPSADDIEIQPRLHTTKSPSEYRPYEPNEEGVPEMAHAGEGYRFHVTGLTHDERGYPAMTPPVQDKLVRRLKDKIEENIDKITMMETDGLEDADVVVVSYGITSRVAQRAIDMARSRGLKVGKMRLITVWPFPEKQMKELATRVKAFVVPEMNLGQIKFEVERAVAGKAKTILVSHAGGSVHRPEQILDAIVEGAK
jgi:2-oxoglutarate ferredoxin oxidoreductase subunit alpha